jgi:hypothetical protein
MALQDSTLINEGFITRNAPENGSMDFAVLRNKAIEIIQQIGGKKWTDFNIHDPGVTIAEILAYALTEIGYRTNSPIEDILTSGAGNFNDLYRVTETLPSAAVTVNDYRKLLIDQANIRNAWITKHTTGTEIPFFYNNASKLLNYTTGEAIRVQGFYDVLIEFEDVSLNTNLLSAEITSGTGITYFLETVFPYWDEITSKDLLNLVMQSVSVQTVPGTGGSTGIPAAKLTKTGDNEYFAVLELSYTVGFTEDFGVYVRIIPEIDANDLDEMLTYTDDLDPGAIVAMLVNTSPNSIINQFIAKNNQSKNIIAEIKSFLHNHRNLCEDFYQYKTVRTQEIALNADIDLSVGSNIEESLAEIFFQVDQFLSPLLQFKSYEELLAKGYKTEEIYEGVLLKHGFLEEIDLTKGERSDVDSGELIIYTSDVFNLIKSLNNSSDFKEDGELIDLRNFSLSNYINNQLITDKARNCLRLTLSHTYKPRLNILKSSVQIFKEGIKVTFDLDTVITLFEQKIAALLSGFKTYPVDILDIPSGTTFDITNYATIQEDFPNTYGIGEGDLAESESNERKAQAKQLKAYLLFFEQILINFLAQLNHIKDLFSYNSPENRSYFYSQLANIPLLADLLGPAYSSQLQNITEIENSESMLERRNKFLNHLVTRFGDNPKDFRYIFKDDYEIMLQKLIALKRKLLQDFPEVSKNHFKAFNYKALTSTNTPDVWDTMNISGYENRVCHLLGFPDCRRRNLYNPVMTFFELYQETDVDAIDEQRFRLRNLTGDILLSSTVAYTDENELMNEIHEVIQFGAYRANYNIITGVNNKLYFHLLNSDGEIIARRGEPFDFAEEIELAIQEVIDFIGFAYIGEGFHLIEHHLLRPTIRGNTDNTSHLLLPVIFNNDKKIIFKDPYSFELTIIIPSGYERDFSVENATLIEIPGMERFRDSDFKRLMERALRIESPAHALLQLFWVDADTSGLIADTPSLNNFERVFKAWLEAMADPGSLDALKLSTQRELVSVLYNIYNPATP